MLNSSINRDGQAPKGRQQQSAKRCLGGKRQVAASLAQPL